MAFKKYVKTGNTDRARASLRERGDIWFNTGAIQCFTDLTEHRFAVLYFDRRTQRIGIRLTDDPTEDGATSVTKLAKHVSIYAVVFLAHCHIDHTTTQQYPLEFDREEIMYIIDLKRPIEKSGRKNT